MKEHTTKRALLVTLGLVAFIMVIGMAGSIERTEQIVYGMSQESYDAIVEKLGNDASQKDIANEYTAHKSYYDNRY